jgi:DNA-binding protein H-NS
MATRKSELTYAEVSAQIEALKEQAEELRKKELAEVVAKIKDAIKHYGLTAKDLGVSTSPRKSASAPNRNGRVLSGKRGGRGKRKSTTRPVKFKDDQGNTWGGLGKRPDWFKAALAAGKTPEDLLAKP